jgi:hypothetical protein
VQVEVKLLGGHPLLRTPLRSFAYFCAWPESTAESHEATASTRVFRGPATFQDLPWYTNRGDNYLVRWPSMAVQASSASESVPKGDPPTLMAHLF